MRVNIIIKADSKDSFEIQGSAKDVHVITLPSFEMDADNNVLRNDIKQIIKGKSLAPSDVVVELFNLFYGVYAADQLVSRSEFGYFSWSRNLKVHLPVNDLGLWESNNEDLTKLLSFLSGDHWEITYRKKERLNLKTLGKVRSNKIDLVSLFSGGLDSLTGVIDRLDEGRNIAIVGHHKGGGTEELGTQSNLYEALTKKYGKCIIDDYFFNVQPMQKNNKFHGENTQRARSILFLGLGILVSNCLGNLPLHIPENGLISLNVPLTNARLGTYSTRTTHPYFLFTLQKVLSKFSLDIDIINPYRFKTKGELLKDCSNPTLLKELYKSSVSCSKPFYYRRYKRINKAHCGHCTPCIIRRASLKSAGLDDPSDYVHDVVKSPINNSAQSGRDTRAFKIGIARTLKEKDYLEFRLLKSGPIPNAAKNLKIYTELLLRGVIEVNTLFKGK